MKVGIMQPYFFPYIGYWQLIKAVDRYVVFDDVNYRKKGWIHKNNILMNGEAKPITLKLAKVSQNKKINEIEIEKDAVYNVKMLKTIKESYSKAPYVDDIMLLLEKVITQKEENLAKYLLYSITEVCKYLDIRTEILLSSVLRKDERLKGQEKIIEICKILSADQYVNASGGISLYSSPDFQSNDISLKFIRTGDISYRQKDAKDFVPNLSIIDVLMYNSPEQVNSMLDNYVFVQISDEHAPESFSAL